jgi:hypothetical protein
VTKLNSRKEIFQALLEFEEQEECYEKELKGENFWELVRDKVYKELSVGRKIRPEGINPFLRIKRRLFFLSKSILFRNPFLKSDADVLYFGDPRRQEISGEHVEKCFEPIIDEIDYEVLMFESLDRSDFIHHEPQEHKARYTDLIDIISTSAALIAARFKKPDGEEQKVLNNLEGSLLEEFDLDLDLENLSLIDLYRFKYKKKMYTVLLRRHEPEAVVYAVGGSGALPATCRNQDVPVAEMQHGFIDENHPDYFYPEDTELEYAPDYFFTWGERWKQKEPFQKNVERRVTGYPFLETFDDSESHDGEKILVISQPIYREQLVDFAVTLSESSSKDVVYRLHPSEEIEEYSDVSEKLKITQAGEKSLYNQFKESEAVLGVNSTALYEAIYFGKFVYLLDIPEAPILNDLIEEGAAATVQEVQEIKGHKVPESVDKSAFFVPNPAEKKIKKSLDEIV